MQYVIRHTCTGSGALNFTMVTALTVSFQPATTAAGRGSLQPLSRPQPRPSRASIRVQSTMVAQNAPLQKETGEGAVLGQPLDSPAAWTATDVLSRPEEWQYVLSDADRAEIVAATRHALATGKAVPVRRRARWGPACMEGGAADMCSGGI